MPRVSRSLLIFGLIVLAGCSWRKNTNKGGGQLTSNADDTGMCSVLGTSDPGERFDLRDDKDVMSILADEGPSAGVGQTSSYWQVGQIISVCFLSDSKGTEALKTRVFDIAKEWMQVANLTLNRVDTCSTASSADIKVRLGDNVSGDTGSWSYIGKVAQTKFPSMNLGWAAQSNLSTRSLRRVVLHEFGHALGLQHEQLNPNVQIPWDKPKVYQYYKDCCGWTTEDVDHNVFRELDPTENESTLYDRVSIMHYLIPRTLLTDSSFETKTNTELSNGDKLWAAIAYPRANLDRGLAKKVYETYLAEAKALPQYLWFQQNKFPPLDDQDWTSKPETLASAHPYANNTSVTKTFELKEVAATFVRARFSRIETEETYDYLSFLGANGTFLDRISGTAENFVSPAVPGDQLSLLFTSDASTTSFGYELKALEYTTKEVHLLGCTDQAAQNYDATAKISDGSCIVPPPDTAAPTPGELSIVASSTTDVVVNWTPATDGSTSQAQLKYLVYYSEQPITGIPAVTDAFEVGISSKPVTGLAPDKKYYFTVIVEDAAGNKAIYAAKDFTTPPPPSAGVTASCAGSVLTIETGSATIAITVVSDAVCVQIRDLFNQ